MSISAWVAAALAVLIYLTGFRWTIQNALPAGAVAYIALAVADLLFLNDHTMYRAALALAAVCCLYGLYRSFHYQPGNRRHLAARYRDDSGH